MIVQFAFGWLQSAGTASKAFKHAGTLALFEDYTKRIAHYSECRMTTLPIKEASTGVLWLCHRSHGARLISSEDLAKKLETVRDNGTRTLTIGIGEADGFSAENLKTLRPGFLWSFGPATYPHELAAVMAAEQLYRAWTILHHLPYHRK